MQLTKFKSTALAGVLLTLTFFPSQAATIKAGGACTKFGASAVSNGYKYNCIKKYGKLTWVVGQKISSSTNTKVVKPSAKPSSKAVTKASPTPLSTNGATKTPSPSPTASATSSATPSPSPTASATSSATPSPKPTQTQSTSPTPSPTPAPSPTQTSVPAPSPTPTPMPAPSPTPTPTPSQTPSQTPSASASSTLLAALIPQFQAKIQTFRKCEIEITNYDSSFEWTATSDIGNLTRTGNLISVNSEVDLIPQVIVTVMTKKANYQEGSANYNCLPL